MFTPPFPIMPATSSKRLPSATLLLTAFFAFTPLYNHAASTPPSHSTPAEPPLRPTVTLSSSTAKLTMDLAGGSIASFRMPFSINPLRWNEPTPHQTNNHGYGHFLCLDRWGPPSDAEGRLGMPYHGEATHVRWSVVHPPRHTTQSNWMETITEAHLPKAGLHVQRTLKLSTTAPVAVIEEKVTNRNPLGRMFNIVQHPTIAPPFLTPSTLIDCNGARGFVQGGSLPNPEEPSFQWPFAPSTKQEPIDLRKLTTSPEPTVTSFIITNDLGWITASSPGQGLLIGYLWSTRDYPWVSHWRDVQKNKPAARGLEFGSTGLHQPFPILARKPFIWERPTFEYLDASASITKSYVMFLVPIPETFQGVETITLQGETLSIRERGKPQQAPAFRTLRIPGLNLQSTP